MLENIFEPLVKTQIYTAPDAKKVDKIALFTAYSYFISFLSFSFLINAY